MARAGTPFADVARQFSDAAEGQTGGLLGLRASTRYPELFVNAVRNQPLNALVGPIRSPAGFHVLKLVDRVVAGLPTTVPQTHARHILLRTDPKMTESQAAERLNDYRRRILSGKATFADLAKAHSQDASASAGGDLGWANPGQFVPEFEQALDALEPNGISEPIVSRFGVHLIQLIERREQALTEGEKREIARAALKDKRLDESFATWLQELRARAYVEYREAP
jgi:peptidyl-prolyl cis-trans isomerase SurA